jgi:hypothetical protein
MTADPDTIAMYVVHLADAGRAGYGGLAVSSIRVHLAAIKTARPAKVAADHAYEWVGCAE